MAIRHWTDEEKEYLAEKYGVISIGQIAKNLDRTESAIINMRRRLKLGRFLENGEYISFNVLLNALGYTHSSYLYTSWIKNRKLPVHMKKIHMNSVRVVYLNEFWNWAEKNQDFLDFSRFEENTLGLEPDWVKAKRKHDFETNQRYIKTPWTPAEDAKLIRLVRQYKYTYDDISKELRRTVGGISRRLFDLGIKERPIKADSHIMWTAAEKELLINLLKSGYGYELMAEKIGRSTKALRGMVNRMYHTENLDKAREIMEKELHNTAS